MFSRHELKSGYVANINELLTKTFSYNFLDIHINARKKS